MKPLLPGVREDPLCKKVTHLGLVSRGFGESGLQGLVFSLEYRLMQIGFHARVIQIFLSAGIMIEQLQDMESTATLDHLGRGLSDFETLHGLTQSWVETV